MPPRISTTIVAGMWILSTALVTRTSTAQQSGDTITPIIAEAESNPESPYSLYLLQRQIDRLSDRIEILSRREFLLKQFRDQLSRHIARLDDHKKESARLESNYESLFGRLGELPDPDRETPPAAPPTGPNGAPAPVAPEAAPAVPAVVPPAVAVPSPKEGTHLESQIGHSMVAFVPFQAIPLGPNQESPGEREAKKIYTEGEHLLDSIHEVTNDVSDLSAHVANISRRLTEMLEDELGFSRRLREQEQLVRARMAEGDISFFAQAKRILNDINPSYSPSILSEERAIA